MTNSLNARRGATQFVRYLVSSTLGRYGLELRRIPPLLSGRNDNKIYDPVTCEYIPSLRGRALVHANLRDARAFHILGLPYDPKYHPFVRAALAGFSAEQTKIWGTVHATLAAYYASFTPESALHLLDMQTAEAPGLAGYPASAWLLPWSARSITETIKGRETALHQVALQYGKRLSLADGLTAFGPVSEAKLSLETDRLVKLIASVKSEGFRPHSPQSPIKVQALVARGVYKWLVEEGQHRLAVAAAMGVDQVTAVVIQVVRREDAHLWPQVVNGVFTTKAALCLFDRVCDALPPSGFQNGSDPKDA